MYSIWYDFRIRPLLVLPGPSIRLMGGAYSTATGLSQSARSDPTDALPRLYKLGNALTVHILAAAPGEGYTTKLSEAHRSRGFDVRLLWYEYFIHLQCECMREEIGIKRILTSFFIPSQINQSQLAISSLSFKDILTGTVEVMIFYTIQMYTHPKI